MRPTSPDTLAPLVRRWQRGWALAAALTPATEADGALHVRFERPRRWVERIVLDADRHPERTLALAERVAASPDPDWLTVPTRDAEATVRLLAGTGLEVDPAHETLMTTNLVEHPAATPPVAPYTVHLDEECVVPGRETVLRASLSAPGHVRAGSGIGALVGTDMIAHAIGTEPEHRRRGLGSVVMGTLTSRARALGGRGGLLVSTPQGRGLYSSLGWRPRATVVVARAPGVE
ncbi:GNAT family N-acetyltransferase [Nocardiopsis sp. NPDC058789]|uniref:GNAT family N-acetyltransferase n=1 Tax=Nocardiopsis eucommiae TaxID=2831970 RepID=A0A975QKQ7_9ACTN|nr:GNAT family N-acetyltransferase [Nocardiopsis eucommiae]